MKKNIAVIFGGRSSEHEVSCVSAATVIRSLDEEKYNVILVGITKDGRWLLVDILKEIEDGSWRESRVNAIISPDTEDKALVLLAEGTYRLQPVDVIFPVLHGLNGEDGTIQGLFEMAQIPYVGCGVLASAVSMDKVYTKIIVEDLGIRQAQFVHIRRSDLTQMEDALDRAKLSYPMFVKPSRAGSSVGVSKAEDREALSKALSKAAEHDRNILVEETIVGREVECAVLGGKEIKASGVGEILAAADFYDYDAKYNNQESKTLIDPPMPEETREEIRKSAAEIFKAVDGYGLSRVDFFIAENGEVVFNEINTLPGFTSISMYPMLWAAQGIKTPALADELIRLAEERFE